MIVRYNMCDFCVKSQKIDSQSNCGIQMKIDIVSAYDVPSTYMTDMINKTFCGKKCMLEFIDSFTTDDGIFQE